MATSYRHEDRLSVLLLGLGGADNEKHKGEADTLICPPPYCNFINVLYDSQHDAVADACQGIFCRQYYRAG